MRSLRKVLPNGVSIKKSPIREEIFSSDSNKSFYDFLQLLRIKSSFRSDFLAKPEVQRVSNSKKSKSLKISRTASQSLRLKTNLP